MVPTPGEPGMALGFVVRATTEVEARQMASAAGGDETGIGRDPWFDVEMSTCVELVAEGPPGVVIVDFVGMHVE